MAEYYFRHITAKAGLGDCVEVASAALTADELGNPVYPLAKRMLASKGIGCKGKVARLMTAKDYDEFDYIVGMDQENLARLRHIAGADAKHKISLLLDHTPDTDKAHHCRDVADPWYTRKFDKAWNDITIGCDALLEELKPVLATERPTAASQPS